MRTNFVIAFLGFAATPLVVPAATLTFAFSGTDTKPFVSTAADTTGGTLTQTQFYADKGTITLSYDGTPASLTLANLTSFSINRFLDDYQTVTYSDNPSANTFLDFGSIVPYLQSTYSQSLADLTSFSAQVTPSGTVTALNFTTTPIFPPGGYYSYPNSLVATTTGGNLIYNSTTTSPSYNGVFTLGTITATPEPASLSVIAIGAMSMLGRRRRA